MKKDKPLEELSKERIIEELEHTRKWRDTYHDDHIRDHNKLIKISELIEHGHILTEKEKAKMEGLIK